MHPPTRPPPRPSGRFRSPGSDGSGTRALRRRRCYPLAHPMGEIESDARFAGSRDGTLSCAMPMIGFPERAIPRRSGLNLK